MEKLTLKDTRFVNESGKEVILHGLNVLQRQRENNHFYPGFENRKQKVGLRVCPQ